jgi:hypothetical protein
MSKQTPRPRGWKNWSEPKARDVLRRLEQSKLSIAAFAKNDGTSTSRIHYWRDRFRAAPKPTPEPFVAVRVRSVHSV